MSARPRDYLADTGNYSLDELLVLPLLGYAFHNGRTFPNAAHVRQDDPSPADPGVGGELIEGAA